MLQKTATDFLNTIESVNFDTESCLLAYRDKVNTESLTSDLVKEYLEALKYLEELSLIKAIGFDSENVLTYLIFGNKYVGGNDDRCRVALRKMIEFISSR